jgi:membrane protein YdbS with pleckstrin-like domain
MDEPGPDQAALAPAPAEPGRLGERLEPRVVVYWYVADLLRALVFGTILVVAAHIWCEYDRDSAAWAPTAAWIVAGTLVAAALIAPPLAYARWSFAVDDELLRMRYGILWVEERLVPVPRMQHVDLTRGPIERLFGLATLVVFTAGNEGSAFRVPGLGPVRAQALRDRILRARGDDRL